MIQKKIEEGVILCSPKSRGPWGYFKGNPILYLGVGPEAEDETIIFEICEGELRVCGYNKDYFQKLVDQGDLEIWC